MDKKWQCIADGLAWFSGSVLIGAEFGWRIGLAVFILVGSLRPWGK